MLFVRAVAAAALVVAAAAFPICAQIVPGITLIEIEYCAYVDDPMCSGAIATFELSFPEGSGVSLENNSVVTFDLAAGGDFLADGCVESGLLCAQQAAVSNDDGTICVRAIINARSLPGGVFGDFLSLGAVLAPADPSGDACGFPSPASIRMYTNCIDPPAPGDVFRRGDSGRFRILDVFPPDCGFIPIAVEGRTWGGIKAMYR